MLELWARLASDKGISRSCTPGKATLNCPPTSITPLRRKTLSTPSARSQRKTASSAVMVILGEVPCPMMIRVTRCSFRPSMSLTLMENVEVL